MTAGVSVTWAATGLPAGLSLDSATGVVSGTPTTAGNYYTQVSATNTATGITKAARNFNILVHPAASS